MQEVTVFVPHDPKLCWRLFTDISLLGAWVPGLRRAQVIAKQGGMPVEVHYEFATMLAYTLVYTYDAEQLEVRWQPKLGKAEGVTGFARFAAVDGGTQLTYGLEHGEGRTAEDREIGDPSKLVAALQTWLIAQLTNQP